MPADRRHTMLTRLSVGAGALAVLATGADHLQQYRPRHKAPRRSARRAARDQRGRNRGDITHWPLDQRVVELFGFSEHGYRPAIVAEVVAIVALTAYLALADVRLPLPLARASAH